VCFVGTARDNAYAKAAVTRSQRCQREPSTPPTHQRKTCEEESLTRPIDPGCSSLSWHLLWLRLWRLNRLRLRFACRLFHWKLKRLHNEGSKRLADLHHLLPVFIPIPGMQGTVECSEEGLATKDTQTDQALAQVSLRTVDTLPQIADSVRRVNAATSVRPIWDAQALILPRPAGQRRTCSTAT
jgi:hypothetical protein